MEETIRGVRESGKFGKASKLAESVNKYLKDPKLLHQQPWYRRFRAGLENDVYVFWPPKERQDPEANKRLTGVEWTGYHCYASRNAEALEVIASDAYMRERFKAAPKAAKELAMLIVAAALWGKDEGLIP